MLMAFAGIGRRGMRIRQAAERVVDVAADRAIHEQQAQILRRVDELRRYMFEQRDRAVIDGALTMALTIVDLWADSETMGSVRDAFPESQ